MKNQLDDLKTKIEYKITNIKDIVKISEDDSDRKERYYVLYSNQFATGIYSTFWKLGSYHKRLMVGSFQCERAKIEELGTSHLAVHEFLLCDSYPNALRLLADIDEYQSTPKLKRKSSALHSPMTKVDKINPPTNIGGTGIGHVKK